MPFVLKGLIDQKRAQEHGHYRISQGFYALYQKLLVSSSHGCKLRIMVHTIGTLGPKTARVSHWKPVPVRGGDEINKTPWWNQPMEANIPLRVSLGRIALEANSASGR